MRKITLVLVVPCPAVHYGSDRDDRGPALGQEERDRGAEVGRGGEGMLRRPVVVRRL